MKNNKNFISKLPDIKTEHQIIFGKYSENSELWEHFFLYLILNKVRWTELNETLCIFQKDFFDKTWQLQSLPLGENHKIIKALNYLIDEKITTKILFTTEKDLNFIKDVNIKFKKSIKITEEFIYRIEDLINLKGRKYKAVRHCVTRFKRLYQYKLIDYRKKDLAEINKFLEIWYKQKTKSNKEIPLSLKEDFKNTKNTFKYFGEIDDLKGFLLKDDDKIIGLSISGVLNKKMTIDFILKADEKYKGITEFLVNEIAKNFSNVAYLNSGGYGKDEALKANKMKFRPVKINSLYKVYF